MEKVKKAKKIFMFFIVLIDWTIGFAFPLLVYANGRGEWAAEAKLRDLLDIILTAPLAAFIGPGLIALAYVIIYAGFSIGDRNIKLIPYENNLKFNAFLCLMSPVITALCVYGAMTDRPMTTAYLITVIIGLLIYLCLALWMPREVQWTLEAIDRFEQEYPDLVNYYSLRARMENTLETYLQIKYANISLDEYVQLQIEEMQQHEKS